MSKKGSKINYYDPSGEKINFKKLKIVFIKKISKETCKNVDLIILLTEWDEFKSIEFKKIVKKNQSIRFKKFL